MNTRTRALVVMVAAVACLAACGGGERRPTCDGNVLVRPCTERECVEGGYVEADGLVHQVCTNRQCVEANGAAECVDLPLESCTVDACEDAGLAVCGVTGYRTGHEPCLEDTTCVTGDGWAACAVADVVCDEPATEFCTGGIPYRCGAHGLAERALDDCTSDQECVVHEGVAFCAVSDVTCPEGASSFCRDGQLAVCAWQTPYVTGELACPSEPGRSCVEFTIDGTLVGECAYSDRPCEATSSWCEPDALVLCGGAGFEIGRFPCATCDEIDDGHAQCL